ADRYRHADRRRHANHVEDYPAPGTGQADSNGDLQRHRVAGAGRGHPDGRQDGPDARVPAA
ncbi:MAG TPA: hypothetical protein VMI73_23810, partial [Trebonia sp.]|nr:hypothetical protein [Trebonia sp.]